MGFFRISQRELRRVEIIAQVAERRMTQLDAAIHLQLSVRQVGRLVNLYLNGGAATLSH